MKIHTILFICCASAFLCLTSVFAQQPAWVDYAKRTSLYPESDYLTGFVSGTNSSNEDPGKLMSQYEELAKSKVIQSIEVSIETNNSLILSNINGKSEETFESKSVSFSKATINSLKVERFYDAKKKNVYAFAYVSKKELAYYNRKLILTNLSKIEQKLAEGRDFLQAKDKQNALKSFYQGMPLLSQAEEAQWLMMAVNREQFIDEDLKKIRKYNAELNAEIFKLQQSETLNMSEAAYFIGYGLFLQIGQTEIPFYVDYCTYENIGLKSDFSYKWESEIKSSLIKTGNYTISKMLPASAASYELKGTYRQEGDKLLIQIQVFNNNQLEAAAEGRVSISVLDAEKISYLPEQLLKIEKLKEIKLEVVSGPEQVKIGRQSDDQLVARVTNIQDSIQIFKENIPVIFVTKEGLELGKDISNKEGLVSMYIPAFSFPEGKSEILVQVDLGAYADIDTNSMYYYRVKNSNPVLPAVFEVQFIPQIYFVVTSETIDNKPVEIKIIEPALKNTLAEQGYQFGIEEKEADYVIEIIAATTAGNTFEGIYFSYVDANMSIIDTSTGFEKYKTSVEQMKGSGGDSKKAGIKALNLASEKLKKDLAAYLNN